MCGGLETVNHAQNLGRVQPDSGRVIEDQPQPLLVVNNKYGAGLESEGLADMVNGFPSIRIRLVEAGGDLDQPRGLQKYF